MNVLDHPLIFGFVFALALCCLGIMVWLCLDQWVLGNHVCEHCYNQMSNICKKEWHK